MTIRSWKLRPPHDNLRPSKPDESGAIFSLAALHALIEPPIACSPESFPAMRCCLLHRLERVEPRFNAQESGNAGAAVEITRM